MYNFKGIQRGCDRLDIGQVNTAVSIISNCVDIKPVYLTNAVLAFTQKIYQPVFSNENYKLAFLFINSAKIYKTDFDSHPNIPMVNQVEMYDVTGNTLIGYTVDVNNIGHFEKDDINPSMIIVGSYRYMEITIDDDNFFYYLYRFKYNGGNGGNGETNFKNQAISTEIWNIPIKDMGDSDIYIPNTYNYPLNQSLIHECYLKTHGRITGLCYNKYPYTVGTGAATVSIRLGDFNPFLTNGELFQIGFITDPKIDSSYFTRQKKYAGLQLVSNNVYTHADGYSFVLLTFRTTGTLSGDIFLSNTGEDGYDYSIDFLGGLFVAFGTFGTIQYTGITDRELAGVMSNNVSTTVDFVDNYNVNSIIQHSLLTYFSDFHKYTFQRTGVTGRITIGGLGLPYNLDFVAGVSSSDSDTIDTGRGIFIIS